jgi:hypothetical protein
MSEDDGAETDGRAALNGVVPDLVLQFPREVQEVLNCDSEVVGESIAWDAVRSSNRLTSNASYHRRV